MKFPSSDRISKVANIVSLIVVVALGATMCSSCSTAGYPGANFWAFNPQSYQGCTVGTYTTQEGTTVTWYDCKDKKQVSGQLDLNGDGKPDFKYSASDVVGSTAAEIRAQVEKAFSEAGVQVIPKVVDGIVKALVPTPAALP